MCVCVCVRVCVCVCMCVYCVCKWVSCMRQGMLWITYYYFPN